MKIKERETALLLRREGMSIHDISSRLGISSSTASRWCADIVLTEVQNLHLATKRKDAGMRALAPYIERNKTLKRNDIALQTLKGKEDVSHMHAEGLFYLGLGLYWGEGYKRGSQECGFTNSDPALIRTIIRWFKECYGVEGKRIIARVTINALYKNQEERILRTWSIESNIPRSQFSRSTFINGYGKPGKNPENYIGTLRIKIRNGTSLRRRILASINEIG